MVSCFSLLFFFPMFLHRLLLLRDDQPCSRCSFLIFLCIFQHQNRLTARFASFAFFEGQPAEFIQKRFKFVYRKERKRENVCPFVHFLFCGSGNQRSRGKSSTLSQGRFELAGSRSSVRFFSLKMLQLIVAQIRSQANITDETLFRVGRLLVPDSPGLYSVRRRNSRVTPAPVDVWKSRFPLIALQTTVRCDIVLHIRFSSAVPRRRISSKRAANRQGLLRSSLKNLLCGQDRADQKRAKWISAPFASRRDNRRVDFFFNYNEISRIYIPIEMLGNPRTC